MHSCIFGITHLDSSLQQNCYLEHIYTPCDLTLKLIDILVCLFSPGWWLIQFRDKSGWVPAAYLQKCCKMENGEDTTEDEDSSNYLGFVVEEGKSK